jgi:cell wall-associated NlpC family hydrolase
MAFSLTSAKNLVGKPRSEYQCNHVVNEIIEGNKNFSRRAADYLHWGQTIGIPAAGVVVVGKDGVHVGIFISAYEFIHSSSSKKQVIIAPLSQLPYVFPKGYEFRWNKQ